MLHHIAIATPNLLTMSTFYKTLPGLTWKENKYNNEGKLRSVWFKMGSNSLLMLEEFPYSKSSEAIIFKIQPAFNFKECEIIISKRTNFTFYFLDPDGNQLGYSSYPNEIDINFFPELK